MIIGTTLILSLPIFIANLGFYSAKLNFTFKNLRSTTVIFIIALNLYALTLFKLLKAQ